jgi:hypothetical protein
MTNYFLLHCHQGGQRTAKTLANLKKWRKKSRRQGDGRGASSPRPRMDVVKLVVGHQRLSYCCVQRGAIQHPPLSSASLRRFGPPVDAPCPSSRIYTLSIGNPLSDRFRTVQGEGSPRTPCPAFEPHRAKHRFGQFLGARQSTPTVPALGAEGVGVTVLHAVGNMHHYCPCLYTYRGSGPVPAGPPQACAGPILGAAEDLLSPWSR